jgi:hypothetical protein
MWTHKIAGKLDSGGLLFRYRRLQYYNRNFYQAIKYFWTYSDLALAFARAAVLVTPKFRTNRHYRTN